MIKISLWGEVVKGLFGEHVSIVQILGREFYVFFWGHDG